MKSARPQFVSVDRIDGDKIIIGFSDGTDAVVTLEQILALFPSEARESNWKPDTVEE